jgi:hypothetical protein
MTHSRQRLINVCAAGHKHWGRACVNCRKIVDGKVRAYFRKLSREMKRVATR